MFIILESSLFGLLYTLVTGYSLDKFVFAAVLGAVSGCIYDFIYWTENSYDLYRIYGKKYLLGLLALIPVIAFFALNALLSPVLGIAPTGMFKILQLLETETLSIYQRLYISFMAFLPAVSGILLMRFVVFPLLDKVSDFYNVKEELVVANKFWLLVAMIIPILLVPLCILIGIYRGLVNVIRFYYKSFKENIV